MAGQLKNDNPTHKLTVEEQRKGGIASGKARNYRKEQVENLKRLLDETSKNGKTYRELMNLGILKGAMQGKAENYRAIMDYLDNINSNTDTPTININIVDNSNLEKAMYEEN